MTWPGTGCRRALCGCLSLLALEYWTLSPTTGGGRVELVGRNSISVYVPCGHLSSLVLEVSAGGTAGLLVISAYVPINWRMKDFEIIV